MEKNSVILCRNVALQLIKEGKVSDKEILEMKMNLLKANLDLFQEVRQEDKSYILGYLAGLTKATRIYKNKM